MTWTLTHRAQAELDASAEDTDGDFAAVGAQDLAERHLARVGDGGLRRGRQRCGPWTIHQFRHVCLCSIGLHPDQPRVRHHRPKEQQGANAHTLRLSSASRSALTDTARRRPPAGTGLPPAALRPTPPPLMAAAERARLPIVRRALEAAARAGPGCLPAWPRAAQPGWPRTRRPIIAGVWWPSLRGECRAGRWRGFWAGSGGGDRTRAVEPGTRVNWMRRRASPPGEREDGCQLRAARIHVDALSLCRSPAHVPPHRSGPNRSR